MILIWQELVTFTGEQLAELSLCSHIHTGRAFGLVHTVNLSQVHVTGERLAATL